MNRLDLTGEVPAYIGADFRAQLARAESLLNALKNLQVIALLPNGQQLSGNIQIYGENAMVYLRADRGGAGGGLNTKPNTMDLTLCDGTQITVVLATGGS